MFENGQATTGGSWQRCGAFFLYLVKHFIDTDCSYKAAALTYTSLLSLVPLIAVSFALLAAFPAFSSFGDDVQQFIISNFVTSSSQAIQGYLREFVKHASQLSAVSFTFLLVTAVLMMFTIEHSFNDIWKVKRRRPIGSALLLYWCVLTLSPIILGVGLVVSTFLTRLTFVNNALDNFGLNDFVLPLIAFILSSSLFTILYLIVPNCVVKLKHAVLGGLIAGILFELSKQGFSIYLYFVPTYQLLYGALAAIPIFFLWVYLSWIIILFGAVVAHGSAFRYKLKSQLKLGGFLHAILWLNYFWQAQLEGKGLLIQELIESDHFQYEVEPEDQLQQLINAKLIHVTGDGKYFLSRDLTRLSLSEVYNSLPWQLPPLSQLQVLPQGHPLAEKLKYAKESLLENLQSPISSLFENREIPDGHSSENI